VGKDGTIYVGTGKGVLARKPRDKSWKLISEDLEDDSIQSMVVGESGQIYAGTTFGLYKGSIEGKWTTITPGFFQTGSADRKAHLIPNSVEGSM